MQQTASLPAGESIVALTSSASTVALQAIGGYSGAVTFPAIDSPASVLLESSTQAPAGFTLATAAKRRVQSGTLSEFFFVSMRPQTTITFPTLPRFTLRLPPTFNVGGEQFYYAISQPAYAGVYAQYRTEGPGNVSGTSVEFDATANPLTLHAGTKYTFVFYAMSANNTSANQLLYVANTTASITAYPLTAQGNVTPVRTLQGPATGLTAPVAITTDSAGNLFVANSITVGQYPTTQYRTVVEVFTEGASGNTAPIRTFDVSDTPSGNSPTSIAVDSVGRIYLAAGPFDTQISVFSPTGELLTVLPQATLQIPGGSGAFLNGGIAIDKRQNLIVTGEDCGSTSCAAFNFILPSNATSTTPPLYSFTGFATPGGGAAPVSSAYAKVADLLFTLYTGSIFVGTILYDQQNAANAPILRQTSVSTKSNAWSAFAVDPTGQKVFLAGGYEILPLVGNASTFVPGTPISGSNTGLTFPLALTVGPP